MLGTLPVSTPSTTATIGTIADALLAVLITSVDLVLLPLLLERSVDLDGGQQQPLGVPERRARGGSVASGPRAERTPKEAARGGVRVDRSAPPERQHLFAVYLGILCVL